MSNLKTFPTNFTIKDIINPNQPSYSLQEIINWIPSKQEIIHKINEQIINNFLENWEDTHEHIFVFKNSIIDLQQNPIILINNIIGNRNLVIKLEKNLYTYLSKLPVYQLRRLGIYIWYFIPDDINLNSYVLKIKNTTHIQVEIKKTGEETVKSDYLWLEAELDSIKSYLKYLQGIENVLYKLTNFFENEIHFHPEKWALFKSKWTIKNLIDFLQYISSSLQIPFEDKKKLTKTENILENYLNWEKLPENPLNKEISSIIFKIITQDAKTHQNELNKKIEKYFLC